MEDVQVVGNSQCSVAFREQYRLQVSLEHGQRRRRRDAVAPPGGKGGSFPHLWVDVQKLCNMKKALLLSSTSPCSQCADK